MSALFWNPSRCSCISIQITWWSLIVTFPNFRNPPWALASSPSNRKIPSIALLPCWCVGVFVGPCKCAMPSTRFNLLQKSLSHVACTSLFMSAITTIWSPSSCHCAIFFSRSCKNCSLGHLLMPCLLQCRTCCWYMVSGPLDLHGWYETMILKLLLFLPRSLAQHHCPSPTVLSPGRWAQYNNLLIIARHVLPS